MPNTIAVAASLTLNHATGLQIPILPPQTLSYSQTGEGEAGQIQSVGTSAEALNIGDVATIGEAVFKNLDDTNYVQIGWDASGFQTAFKLLPGRMAIVPLDPSRTWQAQANTAAVELFFRVLEA